MPKSYREKEKDRRKAAIYETAARILCNLGYEKASIRNIADAMGMTKAGLYYYFQSKEELLYHILNSYMDDLLAGIEKIHEQVTDPLLFLRECIHFQVNLYCRDKYRSKLIIHDENCLSGAYYKTLKEKQRHYLVYWRNGLENYCEQEGIKTDHLSANVHFLVGMCNWTYQWYNTKGVVKPDELAERIFNIFFYGFRSSTLDVGREEK